MGGWLENVGLCSVLSIVWCLVLLRCCGFGGLMCLVSFGDVGV